MQIIESYLNEYKQSNLMDDERSSISDKIFKYIIGSCFKKMRRRAFHWASSFMIGSLSFFEWDLVPVPNLPVPIKPDRRLSFFLNATTEDNSHSNKQTFGQWVMTYHPSKSLDSDYLDAFITLALGSSDYQFDEKIAAIFHNLFLSSLYAYLCLMVQLDHSIRNSNVDGIRRYVGPFSNAIRIFYLVSHSNATKAYFTYVGLPLTYPTHQTSTYHKNQVCKAIKTTLAKLGWKQDQIFRGGNDGGGGEDPNPDSEESYMEDFKENDSRSIYRRSFMSFVDHHAGLRLLERRSHRLSEDEIIKLSLVAVKPLRLHYFPWVKMERVINKTCQDFRTATSNPIEGQDIINKIREHLDRIDSEETDEAIRSFQTLMKRHDNTDEQIAGSQNPSFRACIHCESSLAAILCQLHTIQTDSDSNLRKLLQACPSTHSSLFTP
jgi:hypothetical protein